MKTYNDYVRYYLETERDPRIPDVVCKLGLKKYALKHGIATPATLSVGQTIESVQSGPFFQPENYVIKSTNDSGSACIFKKGKLVSGYPTKLFRKNYGADKGEWFYSEIEWCLFMEEFLEDNITDYKFHCHNGRVMFCQLIFDRAVDTKECIILPDRTFLDYRLDENFKHSLDVALPPNWDEMLDVAAELAADWKYVRVDLYNHKDEVYVGELTFAPRAGRYKGEGQEKLGRYFS